MTDPTDPTLATPAPNQPPVNPWMPAPTYAARQTRSLEETLRLGLVVLLLLVFAVALLIGATSVLRIIEIWFEYQYVPIAKAVLATIVAVASALVLRTVLRRGA